MKREMGKKFRFLFVALMCVVASIFISADVASATPVGVSSVPFVPFAGEEDENGNGNIENGAGELTIATDTLPDAQVGRFYSARVRGYGGTPPYEWSVENAPEWLQVDTLSGVLSGTPTEVGIHDLTVRLEDSRGNSQSKRLRLSVFPHDGLSIMTRVLPAAMHEQTYSARLEGFGGIPPYFFTMRRNTALPPGLMLNRNGTLSGTPRQRGIHNFVVDVLDGNGLQGSASFTMAVLGEDFSRSFGFRVRELEDERRLRLYFYLPNEFNAADISNVQLLLRPDVYVATSGSSVTRGRNGTRVTLALYIAQGVLNDKGWRSTIDELIINGIVVNFGDGSGGEISLAEPLPVRNMPRAQNGNSGSGEREYSGCSVGFGGLVIFLMIPLFLRNVRNVRKV